MYKKLYRCKTPIGKFYIALRPDGLFCLLDEAEYEYCTAATAQSVADNLYTHSSDCVEWDDSDYDGPQDLSYWYRLP